MTVLHPSLALAKLSYNEELRLHAKLQVAMLCSKSESFSSMQQKIYREKANQFYSELNKNGIITTRAIRNKALKEYKGEIPETYHNEMYCKYDLMKISKFIYKPL